MASLDFFNQGVLLILPDILIHLTNQKDNFPSHDRGIARIEKGAEFCSVLLAIAGIYNLFFNKFLQVKYTVCHKAEQGDAYQKLSIFFFTELNKKIQQPDFIN